jgi:hypothetical protein
MDKSSINFALLFIGFLTMVNCMQAQSWDLLQEGKQWNHILKSFDPNTEDLEISGTLATKFMNDTLINDTLYKEVLRRRLDWLDDDWDVSGYVREDDDGFYFRNTSGEEGQLYAYNLEVGDEFEINNVWLGYDPIYVVTGFVQSIDSVLVGDSYKKRYGLYSDWFDSDGSEDWVEGVGSLMGVINPAISEFIDGGTEQLLCYSEDDEVLFKNPLTGLSECYYESYTTSVETVETGPFKTYPNPVTNSLWIECENYSGEYKILDINAKCIMNGTFGCVQLDVSTLKPGIYILELNSDGTFYRHKFIKV